MLVSAAHTLKLEYEHLINSSWHKEHVQKDMPSTSTSLSFFISKEVPVCTAQVWTPEDTVPQGSYSMIRLHSPLLPISWESWLLAHPLSACAPSLWILIQGENENAALSFCQAGAGAHRGPCCLWHSVMVLCSELILLPTNLTLPSLISAKWVLSPVQIWQKWG